MKRWAMIFIGVGIALFLCGSSVSGALDLQRRNHVSYLRGPYNIAFFHRHNSAFRISSAIHFAHAKQQDILQLTPLARSRA